MSGKNKQLKEEYKTYGFSKTNPFTNKEKIKTNISKIDLQINQTNNIIQNHKIILKKLKEEIKDLNSLLKTKNLTEFGLGKLAIVNSLIEKLK